MAEKVVNGFMKGMSTDMHYSLLDNQQYSYAENIRPVSSGFNTTGAIENIKGNKFIGDFGFTNSTALIDGHVYMVAQSTVIYNSVTYDVYSTFTCTTANGLAFTGTGRVIDITAYGISSDMYVIGGVELRDSIILFTTNNTRSQIYKLTITGVSNGEIDTLTLLYDDEYNVDDSRLEFNVNNRIKAIARYETPNIQKVYWTDGINPLRYMNINKECTTNGDPFTTDGDYWGVDKFELLPKVVLDKPTITGITTGTISTGMVFYAYQLYIENGAESAISYISDPLHVTSASDYYSSDLYYEGDGVDPVTSKGFIININMSGNNTFDRLKLIRVHYESFNQVPSIYVAADIPINLDNASITLTDIGSVITELTVEEFAIDSTEIFICQELATKNNILFAGNIEKKTFTIDDFDARAVRFRNYIESSSTDTTFFTAYGMESSVTAINDYYITYTILNFSTIAGIPNGRTLVNVTYAEGMTDGDYEDTNYPDPNIWNFTTTGSTITNITYNFGADILEFTVTSISQIFNYSVSSIINANIQLSFNYSYSTTGGDPIVSAGVYDSILGNVYINTPATDTIADWNTAGWSNYIVTHDGINNYNNPDNDLDPEKQFIYKSDGMTLGAEGPNVEIEFKWEDFAIDDISGTASTYYVGTVSNGSYSNYSSPLNGGKLSWQRDEVYRLFVSFKNTRGQDTEPKWICDLRIPKMVDSTYGVITNRIFSMTQARRVYPVIKIKSGSWPTDAVSAQVYRVPRNKEDRQIVTQALAYPFTNISGWYLNRGNTALDYYSSGNENLVKLVSPEINITKNITKSGNDYLEFLTDFSSDSVSTGGYGSLNQRSIIKCRANTVRTAFAANDYTDIVNTTNVIPLDDQPNYSVGGVTFYNYNDVEYINAKGSTGLVVKYSNNSWTAEGKTLALVNYKNNCWDSQYGGLTYENRQFNNMIPCSDVIYTTGRWTDCNYGDTFITYFDVSTLLYDMDIAEGNYSDYSKNESIYVPIESSINCNLRSGGFETHKQYNVAHSYMIQEELGAHMFTDSRDTLHVFNQTDDMYKYNTVYSQQPLLAALVSIDESRQTETVFDTQIKASLPKLNGEYVDSWTKFGVNETIEVDSLYGSLNALLEYGHSLYFWQDKAFGTLSVNDRSVIQDNNTSQLVLGTGGVLDRYDYISTQKGCEDKFSVVAGVAGIYWIDRNNRSINRFAESLSDLALQKGVKSLFLLDENLINWSTYLSIQDKENNEVIFTLADYVNGSMVSPGINEHDLNKPFTLCFNETIDMFNSIYSFVPYVYIPYKNTYLTNSRHNVNVSNMPANLLFVHNVNENVQARNNFYGLYYNDVIGRYRSKVRLAFNPYYLNTKVFDNLFINGEVKISSNTTDVYKRNVNELMDNELCPVHDVLFYNDYQTTGVTDLVYKSNLERRERTWSTVIPRNAVNVPYGFQANDPTIETLTHRTDFQERMRDKYLVCEFNTNIPTTNTDSYRFIIENLGVVYRNSYR